MTESERRIEDMAATGYLCACRERGLHSWHTWGQVEDDPYADAIRSVVRSVLRDMGIPLDAVPPVTPYDEQEVAAQIQRGSQ